MSKSSVFLSPARVALIRRQLQEGNKSREAALASLEKVIAETPDAPVPGEWFIPWYYVEPEKHHQSKSCLMNSANGAYARALRFLLQGGEADRGEVLKRLEAWAGLKQTRMEQDSRLSFSYHFPALIFAASMLHQADALPKAVDEMFSAYLVKHALPMATVERENNWGNWGLVLQSAIASYLEDRPLLEASEKRWKELLLTQVADDGHLPHEVGRNDGNGDHGIWYSHFSLAPQAIAGEILENAGFPVFSFEKEKLALAYANIARWSWDPDQFPYYKKECGKPMVGLDYIGYFEILQPRMPNAAAETLLQKNRPIASRHSVVGLTLTAP